MADNRDSLTIELKKDLEGYSEEVTEAVKKAVDETAKSAVEQLKTSGGFLDRTGKYRRGWSMTAEKSRLSYGQKIYNSQGHLTHLLENGHRVYTKNGTHMSRKFEHIRPVEQQAIEELTKKIEEILAR